MKKKVWYVLGAVLLIALGVWGIGALLPHQEASAGEKSITIDIYDKTDAQKANKAIVTLHEDTDAKTLSEFMKEEKDVKAVVEQGEYGSLLTEIYGLKQDMEKGPWLVYDSDNNASCLEAGMCPAMDEVVLKDGDYFRVELISSFE